jgi:hypothetical protein
MGRYLWRGRGSVTSSLGHFAVVLGVADED